MPLLAFEIQADYDKVIRLREEIHKLKEEIKTVDAVSNPQQFNTINQKIKQSVDEYNKLTEVAAKAGAKIVEASRKQIYDAQQAVNGLTEDIIKQKNIIADTSDKLKVLTDKYKDLRRNGQNIAANSMLPDINKAKKALDEEKFVLFDLTQERAKAQLGVKKLREEYALFAKDSGASSSIFSKMKSEIVGLGAGMLAGFGLKELGAEIIRVRGQFQQADTAIQTLLGNKEKADALLAKVREYAKISPLEFGDITKATQMMLGFNIEAEKVPGFIKAIGDVSMGESSRFNSLTLAFSQMSATGKLMGQDLNQMINAGFNPLQVMAEKSGKSVAQLKEEMSKGAITAEMVQQAFVDATSAGGKFYNMSENAAKTINGQLSMMHDAIDSALNDIGKDSEGVIVGAISGVTKLIENYETLGRVLMGLTATYGAYRTAVALVTFAENGHTLAMTLARAQIILTEKAQALLNTTMLANPYVLAATAIAGLVSALALYKKSADEAELANERLNKSFGITQAEISSEQKKIDELFDKLRKAEVGTNEYKDVKDAILKQYGSYLEGLNNEIATLKDVEGAYKAVAAAARDAALARGREAAIASANSEYNQKYSEYIGKIYDQLIKKGFNENDTKRMLGWIQSDLKKTGKVAEDTQRALHKYGVEFSWFGELNKAESGLSYETQKINAMFGEQGKVVENTSKKVSKLSEDYKAAERSFRNAKNWLKQIEKNKSDYTTEEYNKALQDYEAKKKAFKDVGGDPDKKKNGGGRTGTKEDIAERVKELNDKQITAQIRAAKDLEFSTREAEIKAMKDGSEKTIAQIDLNRDKELDAIERAYEDLRQKRIDEAKQLWDADPSNNGKNFFESDKFKYAASDERYTQAERSNKAGRIQSVQEIYNRSVKDAIRNEEKANKEAISRYIAMFGDYAQQKQNIYDRANDKICELEEQMQTANTEEARKAIEAQVAIVKKGAQDEVNELDKKFGKTAHALGDLFADASKKSASQIDKLLKKYRAFMQFYSNEGVSKDDLVEKFGFTDKEIEEITQKLKTGEVSLKEYQDGVEKLQQILSSKSPWRSFTSKIDELNEKINKSIIAGDFDNAAFGEALQAVGDQIDQMIPQLDQLGEAMGSIFHFDKSEYADAINGLQNFGNLAKGVGQIYSGDYIGGIANAASGIAGLVSIFSFDEEEQRDAQHKQNVLSDRLSALNESVQRLTDKIDKVYGAEALLASEEARQKAKEKTDFALEQLKDSVFKNGIWDNLPIGGKSHLAWQINEAYGFGHDTSGQFYEYMKKMAEAGFSQGAMDAFGADDWEDLFANLADKEIVDLLIDIKENHEDWWAEMVNLNNGYGEEFFNSIIESYEDLEEIDRKTKENITQTSFDSVFSTFMSALEDLADGSKDVFDDVSENWQKMVNKMVLYNLMGSKYKRQIEEWYDLWDQSYSADHTITKDELEELRTKYNNILRAASDEIDMLRESGLIKTLEDATGKDQTATVSMAEKATYDQFDTYLGIATAQQIAQEQIKDRLDSMTGEGFMLMNMNIEQLVSISANHRDIADESRDILSKSYLELMEANVHLGKIEKSVGRIESSVNKTERLINERL